MKTFMAKVGEVEQRWWLVDASDKVVGRLASDIAMVLIEHDMDLALGLVDSVTVMHEGRVLLEAAPDQIRGNAQVQEVYLGRAA